MNGERRRGGRREQRVEKEEGNEKIEIMKIMRMIKRRRRKGRKLKQISDKEEEEEEEEDEEKKGKEEKESKKKELGFPELDTFPGNYFDLSTQPGGNFRGYLKIKRITRKVIPLIWSGPSLARSFLPFLHFFPPSSPLTTPCCFSSTFAHFPGPWNPLVM